MDLPYLKIKLGCSNIAKSRNANAATVTSFGWKSHPRPSARRLAWQPEVWRKKSWKSQMRFQKKDIACFELVQEGRADSNPRFLTRTVLHWRSKMKIGVRKRSLSHHRTQSRKNFWTTIKVILNLVGYGNPNGRNLSSLCFHFVFLCRFRPVIESIRKIWFWRKA